MRYAAILFLCAASLYGQAMITLAEGTTVQANPLQIGILNGSADNYGPGQITKNWLAPTNPSFQGILTKQLVPVLAGTTGTLTGYNIYDLAPSNIWAGATWLGQISPSGDSFPGESGTITSNTVANFSTPIGVIYTFGSTVAHAPAQGDYAAITQDIESTPGPGTAGTSAFCSASGASLNNCIPGSWTGNITGNAIISTETTDLPSGTYDTQALTLDTTASGAAVSINADFDATYTGKGGNYLPMWNGTSYTASIKCKVVSGTSPAPITFLINRSATSPNQNSTNSSNPASCTNSWSTISYVFSGIETSSTGVGIVHIYISLPQGSKIEITDSFLGQTTTSGTNYSEYIDTYVNALKALAPGSLRLWDGGDGIMGDSFDDGIKPVWGRHLGSWVQSQPYWTGVLPQSGYYDHLTLCQLIGVPICTFTVPASWSLADYQHLIQFIAGTSGTYPSKRAALDALSGRPTGPFSSAIPTIVIELTDEPWNSGFDGENMPGGVDSTTQKAYGLMASAVFTAMKADSTYVSNIKAAINCQTGSIGADNSCLTTVLPYVTNADYVLLTDYFGSPNLGTIDTLNHEFDPQTGFGYSNANDTTNGWVANWHHGLTTTFPSYSTQIGIYEGGYGTSNGTVSNAQIAANNSAMIEGAEIVQGYMETMKVLGITDQDIFSASQDYYNNENPIWGIGKDLLGGQLAGQGSYYFRQAGLAAQIANGCIGLGSTMYGATVSGATTYSTSALNGWPAWSNLPYLTVYAFSNGTNRCLLFANTDPVNAATISITGTNAPTTATKALLTGSSISSNNETVTPGVTIVTSSGAVPSSVPAYSVMSLSWSTGQPAKGVSSGNVISSGNLIQ